MNGNEWEGIEVTVLPVLLFIAGIVFLLLGWRWQNPPSTEVLTAMKGLAHLKREINRLEEDLTTLDEKIDNKEQGLTAESPEWRRMETKLLEIVRENQVQEINGQALKLTNSENTNDENNCDENNWSTLPEKYRKVLEFAQYNFTVSEISKQLGISQDAVTMVLRTYQRGGKM